MQSVLVAPVGRSGIVLGKMLGGTLLSLAQVLPLLILAPFVGLRIGAAGFLVAAGTLTIVAFGLTGLGFILAWRLDSTQGFHAIMNLFLIPMWLLCGAVFPASGAPGWLRAVMEVNPLTYGMSAVRWAIYGRDIASTMGIPGFAASVGITVGFAALVFAAACATRTLNTPCVLAIRSAARHVLLAPERGDAVAAVPGDDLDRRLVEELHRATRE